MCYYIFLMTSAIFQGQGRPKIAQIFILNLLNYTYIISKWGQLEIIFFFCKMILSKSQKGTESCNFIGFVEKKLFRIKLSLRQKAPPFPPAWYRVKNLLRFTPQQNGCLITFQKKSRSSHRRCSIKKLFLKTLEYSQENTCVGVSFFKHAEY